MPKYIDFTEVPSNKKTLTYEVVSKEGAGSLGVIKWYAPWRKYSFFPNPDTLYETRCLTDIVDFIKQLTEDRKIQKQNENKSLIGLILENE